MEAYNKYHTAVKDSDQCHIYKAAIEVVNNGDTILSKYFVEFKSEMSIGCGTHILGI